MCDQDGTTPLAPLFAAPAAGRPGTGSRRHKLWELPANTHCPVIGVCLPLALLRRLVNKGVRGEALADDYEIHVGAVAECGCRNRLSHMLQDALDQRFAMQLHAFRAARSAEAVLALWREATAQGDPAGAFWAALTHPRSDLRLQDTVLREMHMIQHQVGAARRIDAVRHQALHDERNALKRELEQQRQRQVQAWNAKMAELAGANDMLAALRAEAVAREARIDALKAELAALRAAAPKLDTRMRLAQRLDERDALLARLRAQLATAQSAPVPAGAQAPALAPSPVIGHGAAEPARLSNQLLLCVGGRAGCVASYRGMAEQAGARFVHHDGGDEQAGAMLDASLAAADLVICQTACISHHAYWRVKEYCKRSGKRCVYVDNPSNAGFSRGLRQIAIAAGVAISCERAAGGA